MTSSGSLEGQMLNRLKKSLSKKYQHTFLMELPTFLSSVEGKLILSFFLCSCTDACT